MSHDHHGHHHHDHSHAVSANADRRYLYTALGLLGGFMVVEVIVGVMAQSLALITDAGHMLTDVGAIALSLVAMRLASRPAGGRFTFGLKRVEILSAQANGVVLLLLSLWFLIEGIARLIWPPIVAGLDVAIVALVGVVINLAATWALSRANRESLNVEGSFQHILTDLYAFIATAIAGFLIWRTGWYRLDAVAALSVAALMFKSGYGLVRESGRVFLEAAPDGLHPRTLDTAMREVTGVREIHDLHVWEVTSGMPCLSAQIHVDADTDCHAVRQSVETMLHDRFEIAHTTIQTEHLGRGSETDERATVDASECVFDHGRA